MITQLNLLPRRSPLLPGESLPSLLVRLEKLNYYAPGMISQLCQAVGGSNNLAHPAHSRQAHTFVRLSILTGLDPAQLLTASDHGFASVLNTTSTDFITLPDGQLKPVINLHNRFRYPMERAQFCPLCLQAAAYHREIWSLKLVTLCLEHRAMLATECPNCGKPVHVTEVASNQCKGCQADLSQRRVTPMQDDTLEMSSQHFVQRWLAAALTSASSPDNTELLNAQQAMPILNLPKGAVARLARSGSLRPVRVPAGKTPLLLFRRDKAIEIAQEWQKGLCLTDVCHWLGMTQHFVIDLAENGLLKLERGRPQPTRDWLFSQQSIIEFVTAIANRLKQTQKPVGPSLSNAAHQLKEVNIDGVMLIKMLLDGHIQGYYSGVWKDNLMMVHFTMADIQRLIETTVVRQGWISHHDIAQQLGVSAAALYRLWKPDYQGEIYGLRRVAGSDYTVYFESQAAARFCANCLNSDQVARILGIRKIELIQKYVRTGQLRVIAQPSYADRNHRFLFWHEHVEQLQKILHLPAASH